MEKRAKTDIVTKSGVVAGRGFDLAGVHYKTVLKFIKGHGSLMRELVSPLHQSRIIMDNLEKIDVDALPNKFEDDELSDFEEMEKAYGHRLAEVFRRIGELIGICEPLDTGIFDPYVCTPKEVYEHINAVVALIISAEQRVGVGYCPGKQGDRDCKPVIFPKRMPWELTRTEGSYSVVHFDTMMSEYAQMLGIDDDCMEDFEIETGRVTEYGL